MIITVNGYTTATDKLTPHITDTALKDRLTTAVNDVKSIANARSPNLFELVDTVEALQTVIEEVRKNLQDMGD